MKTGLALILVPFASTFAFSLLDELLGGLQSGLALYYFLTVGTFAVVGFSLLIISLFLPSGPDERPTFTEELLGKERMQYGSFATGNWREVLDEEEKREAERRRGASSAPES